MISIKYYKFTKITLSFSFWIKVGHDLGTKVNDQRDQS